MKQNLRNFFFLEKKFSTSQNQKIIKFMISVINIKIIDIKKKKKLNGSKLKKV